MSQCRVISAVIKVVIVIVIVIVNNLSLALERFLGYLPVSDRSLLPSCFDDLGRLLLRRSLLIGLVGGDNHRQRIIQQMLAIITLLIPARSAALLATILAAINCSGVVFIALITLGSMNLDLLEGPVHVRLA
jgi:hypothetical protein